MIPGEREMGRRTRTDAERRPMSYDQKGKLRQAQLDRLGIPAGYCKVYGIVVPIEFREECRAAAARAMRVPENATRDHEDVSRAAIRQLILDKIDALQKFLNSEPSMKGPVDDVEDEA